MTGPDAIFPVADDRGRRGRNREHQRPLDDVVVEARQLTDEDEGDRHGDAEASDQPGQRAEPVGEPRGERGGEDRPQERCKPRGEGEGIDPMEAQRSQQRRQREIPQRRPRAVRARYAPSGSNRSIEG